MQFPTPKFINYFTVQLMLNKMKLQQFLRMQTFFYQKIHPQTPKSHLPPQSPLDKLQKQTFINRWAQTFTNQFSRATGKKVIEINGRQYMDFAFGSEAIHRSQRQSSINSDANEEVKMVPAEDTEMVAEQLCKKFDFQYWSFCKSGLDANLLAIKLAKFVTERSKIIVVSGSNLCYQMLQSALSQRNQNSFKQEIKQTNDSIINYKIDTINDLDGLEKELDQQEVAAILLQTSNLSTSVICQPAFLEYLGILCEKYGTLIISDETSTFSIGYGGMAKELGFKPDFITFERRINGKTAGTIGTDQFIEQKFTNGIKQNLFSAQQFSDICIGSPESVQVMKNSLEWLNQQTLERMMDLSTKIKQQSEKLLIKYEIPWTLIQFGTKISYIFPDYEGNNSPNSLKPVSQMLKQYLYLFLLNRGIVINPSDCTARLSPVLTESDVDKYCQVFGQALNEIRKIYAIKAKL